jgi:AAA domain-containing protein/bifunctional DNA primase/polymerase-like protein/primase-like protein
VSATQYLDLAKEFLNKDTANTPTPQAEAIAAKFAKMGAHIMVTDHGTKRCTTPEWEQKATNNLDEALQIAKTKPNGNVMLVGKQNGIWALDDDAGLVSEYEKTHGVLETYTTRTVSGGRHFIFRQNAESWALGNVSVKDEQNRELLSARVNDRYVIAAGSWAHPHNDASKPLAQYVAINPAASIVEAPASLLEFIKRKDAEWKGKKSKAPDNSTSKQTAQVLEGGRNNYLTSRGGRLRDAGASFETILFELTRINESECIPPLPSKEVESIAHSVAKYPEGTPPLILNQVPTSAAPVDVSDWRSQFKSVSELEEGEPRMLIRNFLPEGTIFIGALPGEGKTLLGLSISKALTTGKNFLAQYDFSVPEITPILYLIPESGGRAFRRRCEKFQIPDDPKLFLARTISEGATLLLHNPWVLEAVKKMKPVVILDTVIRFSEADDENQASQNKQMVEDIIRLRQAGAVAVIGMHHATKAMREKGMSLETALRGTGDIAASADAVYGMLRDDKLYASGSGPNEIDVACLKPRDFEPPKPFRIAASEKSEDVITGIPLAVSVIDQTHDFRVVSDRAKTANVDDKIREMIANDPSVTRKVLMEETGVSDWEVRQALKRIGLTRGKGRSTTQTWHQKTEPKSIGGSIGEVKVVLQ